MQFLRSKAQPFRYQKNELQMDLEYAFAFAIGIGGACLIYLVLVKAALNLLRLGSI